MRINLLLLVLILVTGLFLWINLSGVAFIFGVLMLLLLIVIAVGYPDTAILFFLGARELKSRDEEIFFQAAAQEAYKLAVPVPKLYFYNGGLERAFVLQSKSGVSLIISRSLLATLQTDELSAICFELLLQVKKNMAPKRTKVMFLIGLLSWLSHSLVALIFSLIPIKEARQAANWLLNYLLNPCLDFLFSLTLGDKYFRKLEGSLKEFPVELAMLTRIRLKIRKPSMIQSLPSRKLMEMLAANRSRHFQNILALEILPHEWEQVFGKEELYSAEKA